MRKKAFSYFITTILILLATIYISNRMVYNKKQQNIHTQEILDDIKIRKSEFYNTGGEK